MSGRGPLAVSLAVFALTLAIGYSLSRSRAETTALQRELDLRDIAEACAGQLEAAQRERIARVEQLVRSDPSQRSPLVRDQVAPIPSATVFRGRVGRPLDLLRGEQGPLVDALLLEELETALAGFGRDADSRWRPRRARVAALDGQMQTLVVTAAWRESSAPEASGGRPPGRLWVGTLEAGTSLLTDRCDGTPVQATLRVSIPTLDGTGRRTIGPLALETDALTVERRLRGLGRPWALELTAREPARRSLLQLVALSLVVGLVFTALAHGVLRKPQEMQRELAERDEQLASFKRNWIREAERRQLAEQLAERSANSDPLTGLSTREEFLNVLDRALEQVRAESAFSIAVLCVDIDGFKAINESLGHAAGDRLLSEVANRMLESFEGPHEAARLTGDRFALLLHDAGEDDAQETSERLRELYRTPFELTGQEIYISISVGIVLSGDGLERPLQLLSKAEVAMDEAKRRGRDQTVFFSQSMNEEAGFALQIESDLRRALASDQFQLYYQPILSLADGKVSGLEALIRWVHPRDGLVAPYRFIPLAEDTGLIVPLTRWVVTEAFRQLERWYEEFPEIRDRGLYVSVNLSAKDFDEPDLPEFLDDQLARSPLPTGSVRLELTEGALMRNVQQATERIGQLAEMKMPLLLDDFGTGYSSLSYLQRFPFDYVKIDRSFTMRLAEGETAIVGTIIALAGELGMQVIAEGVENLGEEQTLKQMGCQFVQGFMYSKPVPSAEASSFVLDSVRGNTGE